MVGAVIVLVVMFVLGPSAVFMGGALWSAIFGWLNVATVDEHGGVDSKVPT